MANSVSRQLTVTNESILQTAPADAFLPDSWSDDSIVGRGAELALLGSIIKHPDVRVLTLTGPGGIGKTRIALTLVARHRSDFPNGVALLARPAGGDNGSLIAAIASAIGLQTVLDPTVEDIALAIGDGRVLVVLDDVVPTSDRVADLAALIHGTRHLKVLATGSDVLGIDGEREFAVPALSVPTVDGASHAQIEREAAVELFTERSRTVAPTFTLNLANAVAVAELCRRLRGIPLAIELVAARSQSYPPQQLLIRLRDRLPALTGEADNAPVNAIVRAVVEWSVELLAPGEQQVFRALSIFDGSFAEDAALTVAGDDTSPAVNTSPLQALTTVGLVEGRLSSDQHRYRVAQPVRDVASAMLDAANERDRVARIHAEWYVEYVARASRGLRSSDQRIWLERLRDDLGNVRVALSWLYAHHRTEEALQLAIGMNRFWASQSRVSEGRAWLERGISNPTGVSSATLAEARDAASWLVLLQGDISGATRLVEENLTLYAETGDDDGYATTLDSLGELALSSGDFDRARRYFDASIERWLTRGDDWHVGMSHISLGTVLLNLGDAAGASTALEFAESRLAECGDQRAYAVAGTARGWLDYFNGDVDSASKRFRAALGVFHELGSTLESCETLEGLAAVEVARGDLDSARRFSGSAKLLRRESGIHASFIARIGHFETRRRLRATLDENIGSLHVTHADAMAWINLALQQ